jgi:asparagine synthase (glutamine-hydrolysing)
MTRWLAGIFDTSGRASQQRLTGVLAPSPATVVIDGPLHVAYTGSPTRGSDPICLLDGYVDNASDLASALRLPTQSTSEDVLRAGWRSYGLGLLGLLRGEFVLLVWDSQRREGVLARDQLGVRSMFLHDGTGALYFASEIRYLLGMLPQRPGPDAASVAHWLAMTNRSGSATLYEGVRRLNPGAALVIGPKGFREETYWTPRYSQPEIATTDQAAAQIVTALDRAVSRRIASDGITCVLMSGGLDSASVAATAAAQAPGRVAAYSAVFPEHPTVDESALISQLRRRLKLPGANLEVRPGGLLASGLAFIDAWGVPLRSWGDFWALPLLRAAASAGALTTLGGDGGDEVFGVRAYLLADQLLHGRPLRAISLARELPGAGDRPARRTLARIVGELAVTGAIPYGIHDRMRRATRKHDAPSWLHPRAGADLLASSDPLGWKRLDGPRWWASAAYELTRGFEYLGVFEHQRRRAASAGLEARQPLFDLDLVELVLRQQPQATFDRYRSRPLLRAAMADRLPDSVRLRPQKAWFDSMIVDCLAGRDGAIAYKLLTDPRAEIGAYASQSGIESALFAGPARGPGTFRSAWQIWRLVMAECWLRAQDQPGAAPPETQQASPDRMVLRPITAEQT